MVEKIEIPKDLQEKTYKAFATAKDTGKIRRGTNETTKAVERSNALLVAISQNVEPPEIVAHLPIICDEKNIPCVFVPKKEDLGKAIGLNVPAASAAITDAGDAKSLIGEIATRLKEFKTGAVKAEKPKEEVKETKVEEKPKAEEKKEKPKKVAEKKTK